MLPAAVEALVREVLIRAGDSTGIRASQSVSGGCIHHVVRIDSAAGSYLFKWNPQSIPGVFSTEASGLELIRATQTIRVPEVLAVAEANGSQPAYILEEWIEPDASGQGIDMARLGEVLAELHRAPAPDSYGLDRDNFIGSNLQVNRWTSNWVEFYRDKRLRFQMELAFFNGRLSENRKQKLERLLGRLDHWLAPSISRPSLLHGDLWGGNVLPGPGGEPVLIDPAVYYGEREAELAYTELFGGFSASFYAAYQAAWPLDPGYKERRDLYNLYHLLNHLNIFGEAYGYQIDAVLGRYI